MSKWVVWSKGLKGPEISVQHHGNAGKLTKDEKNRALAEPIMIDPEHEDYCLSALAVIYPAPLVRET